MTKWTKSRRSTRHIVLCEDLEARCLLSTSIQSGSTVTGQLAAGAKNYYSFSAKAGGGIEVTMEVTKGYIAPEIDILGTDGKPFWHNSNQALGSGTHLLTTATTTGI